jgi:hypothetical protein
MTEAHVLSCGNLSPAQATPPSPSESGDDERVEALLRQVHEQRACIRRLHYANLEAEARRAAEAERAKEAQHSEALLREQSRHHQERIVLLQSQVDQLFRQHYELTVQLSALRHRAANKVVRLIQKIPGLEALLRKALRLAPASAE